MNSGQVRVFVEQLKLGMYVQELDRPWLESPFLFQGFLIDSDELLQQVKDSCEFVFISIEESLGDIRPHLLTLATQPPPKRAAPARVIVSPDDNERENFLVALRRSRISYDKTSSYIDTALEDVRLGRAVNTQHARMLVAELVDNIVRSPNAVMWLTYLKKRDEYTPIHCVNVCIL